MKQNGFDSVLMSTIQLKLKSSGKLDDVIDLLTQLDTDLANQQNDADSKSNVKNAEWTQNLSDLETQITDLSAQIINDQQRILDLTTELIDLNKELVDYQTQESTFTDKRASLVEARLNDIAAYNKRVSDQQAMSNALTNILDLLQAKTTTINLVDYSNLIQTNLRKFKEVAGPYATLVGLTLSFDPEVVRNIMTKLVTIQEAVVASLQEDKDKEAVAKYDYDLFLQSIDLTLETIAKNIKETQQSIVDDELELTEKEDTLEVEQSLLQSLNTQKSNVEKLRDVYNAAYDKETLQRSVLNFF